MLFHSRNLVPWITGALAIGGLVAMSMMEVPDERLTLAPAAAPATPVAEPAAEPEVAYCADGATRSYSDRPCEPQEQLQLIPFTIDPAASPR